jgi:hypothetical protein
MELELEFGLMTMTKYNDNDPKGEHIQPGYCAHFAFATVIQRSGKKAISPHTLAGSQSVIHSSFSKV